MDYSKCLAKNIRQISRQIYILQYVFFMIFHKHYSDILVKKRAWSPPVPVPFCHVFYKNFYINRGTTFFQVGKCYIWLRPYHRGLRFGTYLGWNFRFGLRSRGQNVSKLLFFLHKCSNQIHKELFKWSEIWHEHRSIYGTDSWLRKFGGPWHKKKGLLGSEKFVLHFWASRSPLRQKWHIPNCS